MEVIPVFKVKSYRKEYSVDFIDDIPKDFSEGVVVMDETIKGWYYPELNKNVITINPREEIKTIDMALEIIDLLTANGFQKNHTIYAVGGGIVQDLVSFVSSILYRGVNWEFIPTTLLAQCDSCIGSKTSINHNGAKNILGGFYPPSNIKICTKFLKTLPSNDIKSGIGEMLHYFLLHDHIPVAEALVNETDLVSNVEMYINKSLFLKKTMIERDEFDEGPRNMFNYGHTFGHAIESLSEYEINHGQAVTMGMEIANRISLSKGLITKDKYERMKKILSQNMPTYEIENVEKYIEILHKDKKNCSDKLTCILLTNGFGKKAQIDYEEVKEIVKEL